MRIANERASAPINIPDANSKTNRHSQCVKKLSAVEVESLAGGINITAVNAIPLDSLTRPPTPAELVYQADDIILAEMRAGLYFDQLE